MLFIITKDSALILTLFFHSVVCANGHIVEGLTGKYLFCVNKEIILPATVPYYYENGRFTNHLTCRQQFCCHNYFK